MGDAMSVFILQNFTQQWAQMAINFALAYITVLAFRRLTGM